MAKSVEWVALIRRTYPPGTRIEVDGGRWLTTLPAGSRGTVRRVNRSGDIHVTLDDGYDVMLVSGRDYFHRVGGAAE